MWTRLRNLRSGEGPRQLVRKGDQTSGPEIKQVNSMRIPYPCEIIFSWPTGFFMDKREINKRITRKITAKIKANNCQIIAVWVNEGTTEFFICPEKISENTNSKIAQLSQSFCAE